MRNTLPASKEMEIFCQASKVDISKEKMLSPRTSLVEVLTSVKSVEIEFLFISVLEETSELGLCQLLYTYALSHRGRSCYSFYARR